jgi:hypothetical protein
MQYRVHTLLVGRNLPEIIQDLPAEPAPIDAMPLLRLMMQAETSPIEDEMIRMIAGPIVHLPPME